MSKSRKDLPKIPFGELVEQGINSLKEFDGRADPLREIARFFVQRTF